MAFAMVGPWLIVVGLLVVIAAGFRIEPNRPVVASAQQAVAGNPEPLNKPVIAATPQAVLGNPGTWGQMEYRTIRIDLPDEFVFVLSPNQPPVRWFFHGFTKEQAIEFLKSSGISPQQQALIEKAVWKADPSGVALEPGDEFILSLAPEIRAKIYERLVEFEENSLRIDPVWFEKGQVDERLKDSGLSPSSVTLLKSLLYPQGASLLLFADFEPALRRLPNDHERRLFANAVSRKRTLLAGLCITPESNMEAIVDYWGVGGRKKDVGPLLHALRHEGEAKVNIVCLLPHFPREHLYTYPLSDDGTGAECKQDCFWSALNFFNDPPDNRVKDLNFLGQLLKTDYAPISQPTQLGDLIFLATPDEKAIHAAAYIADDIVFTKNGASFTQPWIFMHMKDMMDTYAVKHPASGPLKAIYYRKKSMF